MGLHDGSDIRANRMFWATGKQAQDSMRSYAPENPYYSHNQMGMEVMSAPPLTTRDIEDIVHRRVLEEQGHWRVEGQQACAKAWEEGAQYAYRHGVHDAQQALDDNIHSEFWLPLQNIQGLVDELPGKTKQIVAAKENVAVEIRKLRDLANDKLRKISERVLSS